MVLWMMIGVEFEMPLLGKSDKEVDQIHFEFSEELKQLKDDKIQIAEKPYPFETMIYLLFGLEQFRSMDKTIIYNFEEEESLVLFKGHQQVHNAYDFLLNVNYPEELPTLLSPLAFVNSTLKQVQIKSNGPFSKAENGKVETFYRLELVGPILPCSLLRLCHVFNGSQKGNFSATFSTLKGTTGINFDNRDSKGASPSNSPFKPLSDSISSLEQLQKCSTLGRKVIRKITCRESRFSSTLSK